MTWSKPVWSPDIKVSVFTDSLIASAAYAHACAMTMAENDEIVSTEMADTGSIGVIMSHWDETKALDEMGLKIQYFAYPPGKADGRLGTSLSDEGAKKLQADINTIYEKFSGLVSRSRGLSIEAITALNADTFLGNDALSRGLVDRVVESGSALYADAGDDPNTPEAPSVVPPETPNAEISKGSTNQVITAEVSMADVTNTFPAVGSTGTVAVASALSAQPSREAELSSEIAKLKAEKAQLEVAAVLASRPDLSDEQKSFLAGKSKAEVEGFLAILPKPAPKADETKANKAVIAAVGATAAKAPTGYFPVSADESKLDRAQKASLKKFKNVELTDKSKSRVSFNEHECKVVIS